ncbi:MAG: GDP-mannose 4,6-dehydratase [Chloroflexota bacterium]|nr:GDP-mannose 4,6-dehydratase [Chloroflexota bacterium]
MRGLITGVGGFVGPHLVAELRRSTDWALFGLCRHPCPGEGYTPLTVDLLDRERVARAVADAAPTHVFHLAAQSHVPTSNEDAGGTLTNNIVGQVNLLDACRALPEPPRVLVIGSAEEYGLATPEEMPLREAQPFRPTNPYAVSKVAQDLLGWQYFAAYRLPVVRVRPFSHTGPGQSDRFAVAAFARQIAEIEAGRRPPVVRVGNLEAQRDFLDVRDVVHAYQLALTAGEPGAVYNIGSGMAVRMRAVLDRLLALSPRRVEVAIDPARLRPSEVPLLVADSSALRAATGWRPVVPFEQSLRDTLDWWRGRVTALPPGGQCDISF